MMTIRSVPIILFLLLPAVASAQSADRHLAAGGGGTTVSAEYVLHATAGQSSIGTSQSTWSRLSAGFHSPSYTARAIIGKVVHASVVPNPMESSARLRIDVPVAGRVVAVIHDATGRRVARVADVHLDAGRHDLDIDGANLASGRYVIDLQIDGQRYSAGFTIVK